MIQSTTTTTTTRSFSTPPPDDAISKEWSKWQESLINTDESSAVKGKRRGGITLRKKQAAAAQSTSLSSQARLLDGGGAGLFPPLRYSDEETERLLKEAYSKLPEKGGKRGSRKLKREKNRYHGIRKARSIKKMEKINHHFDKMDKRSLKSEGIRKMIELAVEVREEDKNYQIDLLRKWAEINGATSVGGGGGGHDADSHDNGAEIASSKE
jgi:hypothetical protein